MSYNKMFSTVAVLAAIGCAAGSHAAPSSHALYASEEVSIRVRLSDLDLTSVAGASAGLRRIHNAAREICGSEPNLADLSMRPIYQSCMNDTVNRAVVQLGNPVVTALNGGHQPAVMASNAW